jgi:outer membrane protein assembly factor BamB
MLSSPRRLLTSLSLVALGLVFLSSVDCESKGQAPRAGDWPLFRGNPLQNGVASSSLPADLVVRWKFKTKDSIEAAVAIVAGVVYAGSCDEHLYALDLATGKEKWKVKLGAIKAAPSYKDGSVYVGTEDGLFFRLDAATGKELWKYDTDSEITSSANFVGDRVLFGASNSILYCLDAGGKVAWKFRIEGGPVNGSPTVAAVAGKRTFVGGCDSKLHIIDVDNGKEVAAVDLGGQTGATAAVAGDQVFIGTMQPGNVQAVNWKKAEVQWVFEPTRSGEFYSSPAVTDKLVILGNRDRHVYALDRTKGELVWEFPTRKRVDGSPVVVGDRVIVGSSDGHLYVLDLAKGKELRKFELGRSIVASPAVAEGCLVIGTLDGVLYCLGKKE